MISWMISGLDRESDTRYQKLHLLVWFCSAMERANVYFVARQTRSRSFLVCFLALAGPFWIYSLKCGCRLASGSNGHSSHLSSVAD
jgi:hypothetical protein